MVSPNLPRLKGQDNGRTRVALLNGKLLLRLSEAGEHKFRAEVIDAASDVVLASTIAVSREDGKAWLQTEAYLRGA